PSRTTPRSGRVRASGGPEGRRTRVILPAAPDRARKAVVDRLHPHDDCEAVVRIYTPAEGGRRTPAFNGLRWDFPYADDPTTAQLYMIWPDVCGSDGRSLPTNQPLPVGVELPARLWVVADEMRAEVHRGRLVPGLRFYCHEGGRRVGEGVVTRLTG